MKAFKRFRTVLILTALCVLDAKSVYAEAGTVYSCTVNRVYRHPVTGDIEDSGGEESEEIGQGMVEGAVENYGMLEVTDSGAYYLTVRMNLMDFTKRHTFWVQKWGASGWSKAKAAISQRGTNENGETADIVIAMPEENCIIRGGMYVEAMGRDVVWYMYPGDFEEGNNYGMKEVAVTGKSVAGSAASQNTAVQNDTAQNGEANEAAAQPEQNARQENTEYAQPEQNAPTQEYNTASGEADFAADTADDVRPDISAESISKGAGKRADDLNAKAEAERVKKSGASANQDSDGSSGNLKGLTLSTSDEALSRTDDKETERGLKRGGGSAKTNSSVFSEVFYGAAAGIFTGGGMLMLLRAGFIYMIGKRRRRYKGEDADA